MDQLPSSPVLCLIGPSGSGKNAVLERACELDRQLYRPVSATTRPPRPGERDGIDYMFVTPQRFAELESEEAFLETADFHGHRYGQLHSAFTAPGVAIAIVENDGARQLREHLGARVIAIMPPSHDTWVQRLVDRGDSRSSIEERLLIDKARAGEILELADEVVVNDDLTQTAQRLIAIAHRLAALSH